MRVFVCEKQDVSDLISNKKNSFLLKRHPLPLTLSRGVCCVLRVVCDAVIGKKEKRIVRLGSRDTRKKFSFDV